MIKKRRTKRKSDGVPMAPLSDLPATRIPTGIERKRPSSTEVLALFGGGLLSRAQVARPLDGRPVQRALRLNPG
jgi:hypothetical protein